MLKSAKPTFNISPVGALFWGLCASGWGDVKNLTFPQPEEHFIFFFNFSPARSTFHFSFLTFPQPEAHPETYFLTFPQPEAHPKMQFLTFPQPEAHPKMQF